MKYSPRITQKSGFTIVEMLVALALIVAGTFVLIGGFNSLTKIAKNTDVTSNYDKQINEISSNIKAGIENYQINFNYKDSTEKELLTNDALPMVWDVDAAGTKEECPWCKGTYGYTIRPLEAMRGLYYVQVRFTHKSWGTAVKDVNFVVSVK